MTDAISPPLRSLQRPRGVPAVPLGPRLRDVCGRIVASVMPGLAGRIATNAFMRSRSKRGRTVFRMPLGARAFAIAGNQDVQHGYLWQRSGPTVLLVHGWGTDSSSMIGFVRPLLDSGFQVASFDAPAHGNSPGSITSMKCFVETVCAALEALGDVRVVISHSFGSIATIAALAQTDPMRARAIERLVMIAAPASLSTVLERWSTSQRLSPAVIGRIHDRLQVANGVPVSYYDISALGAAMEMPILVVHDEDDPVVPLAEAQWLTRGLKHVRLEQTSGLGHSRILSAAPVKEMITCFISDPPLSLR